MKETRTQKSIKNARISLFFYFISIFISFFSRKIFLEYLGADFIGLTGTLGNILGYLNLAELGIGAAVSFNLYKPLQENDKNKLIELISLYGYYYRKIGIIVLSVAVIVSLFIPLIFKHTMFSYMLIYFAFFSFLLSSLFGYFINYRQILLSADQKDYVVVIYSQTLNIVIILIQLLTLYLYKNYYLWIAINVIAGIGQCIILNWKIDTEYPWLKTDISCGKILSKKYPQILKSTKQVFIHKIKDFILTQSDQILIFAFVSLKMVAYYGNYTMIITKATSLFDSALNSFGAGVGNLVAEKNDGRIMHVFWELMAIRYFVAGIVVFSIYHLADSFICIWLGKQYLLGNTILVLMIVNLFIIQTRGVVDMFNHAYGHYADTWSAWGEGFLNITVTIVAASHWGIAGILLGKIVSLFFIVVLWKPYYLFNQGFRIPIKLYWIGVLKYLFVLAFVFTLMTNLIKYIPVDPQSGFLQWGIYAVIIVMAFTFLYSIGLLLVSQGAKDAINRIPYFKNKK